MLPKTEEVLNFLEVVKVVYIYPLKEGSDTTVTTLWLPGVLGGLSQPQPIVDALPAGDVDVLVDKRRWYSFDPVAERVLKYVEACREHRQDVVLVGASKGGMEAVFIVEKLRAKYDDVDAWLKKVVLVDSPSGLETIKDPMAKFTAVPVVGTTVALSTFFAEVPINDDMLPKIEEISDGLDPVVVRQQAKDDLEGYSLSQLVKQTAWMVKVGRDGSLARAAKSLESFDVTYVTCVHPGNGVVRQPEAVAWWRKHLPGMNEAEVNGTHCGFLQNQREFEAVFGEIFG